MTLSIDNYTIETCRQDIIDACAKAMMLDEFDDRIQRVGRGLSTYHDGELVQFVHRNWSGEPALEIGCGSGDSFEWFPTTHAIEPCIRRYETAIVGKCTREIDVRLAFAECIPFDAELFRTVFSLSTWHYLRSQLEGFIEVNRVLQIGGIFIFDIWGGLDYPYGGITMDARGILSILTELGFRLQEIREYSPFQIGDKTVTSTGLAVVKRLSIDLNYLRKLQCIQQSDGSYKLNNFHKERDAWLV